MTRPLVSLLDAFVPALCISCKAVGSLFCSACRHKLSPRLHAVERSGFVGWSVFDLDVEVVNLVLSFKDRGRTALSSYLARLLLPALEKYRAANPKLVSLPSSRSAIIRRGFDSNAVLLRRLSKVSGLARAPRAISLTRQPGDQRGLTAEDRVLNLHGTMVAKKGSGPVLLVDDVVTSGASILEGRRALIAAGFEVVGFITIAETLLEKSKKTSKVRAGEPEWV